jgi:uncharacterized protein (DUF342 family)
METSYLKTNLHPEIIERGDDHWIARIRLSVDELIDNRKLLVRLNQAKRYIAKSENMPMKLLRYEGIIERHALGQGLALTVKVIRLPIRKGDPVVRFSDKRGKDGSIYPDMKATMDINPLDSQGQTITYEKIILAIQESGVSENLLNLAMIKQKVQRVIETKCSLEDTSIAIGILPELGEDAKVEFCIPTQSPQAGNVESYGSRHVKKQEIICRKSLPTEGRKPGVTVKGKEISSKKGMDTKLRPLKGVSLSQDELEAIADENGMLVVREVTEGRGVPGGVKVIPTEIQLRVNPVLKVRGDEIVNVTTSLTVEVIGNLKTGSKIVTEGEVHISGSVEEGSVINSSENISINGNVASADLSSGKNIMTRGNVSYSRMAAKNQVIIDGELRSSDVVCSKVSAKRICSSNIIARNELKVDRLDDDENNLLSGISVGAQQFLESRYQKNKDFLEQAEPNLKRITNLIGEPFVNSIKDSNLNEMWGKFCSEAPVKKYLFSHHQLVDLKTVFLNIPTLRALIKERQEENQKIKQTMAEPHDENVAIEVREKVGKTLEVQLNRELRTLEASQIGVRIDSGTSKNTATTTQEPLIAEIMSHSGLGEFFQ